MLIVEDGITPGGVQGAESYVDVAFCDAYWAGRNPISAKLWADLKTPAKEAALRESCQYLDQGWEFIGSRWNGTQYLNWPRATYGNSRHGMQWMDMNRMLPGINTIPLVLKQAQCELALEAAQGKLAPSYDPSAQVESVTIGPLAVKYGSGQAGMQKPNKRYPLLTLLLKDIATSSNVSGLVGTVQRG